jgi:predicted ATPase/DNA-binding SARP family transcriptional activator
MLELLLFGTMEIKVDGDAVRSLSARARQLLAYLVLNTGRTVTTAAISTAIFPDSQAEDPHDLVKKTASELRRMLGKEGSRLSSPAPRQLDFDLEGADVDWLAFKSAIKRGDLASLQHAVTLHAQPLLDMEPHFWAVQEQEVCLRQRQSALETLYRSALANGDLEDAGVRLLQMLAFELPEVTIREELWQEFMGALLSRQEYGKIQLHYGRLQAFLHNTTGRPPREETQALFNRVPKSILLQLALAGNKRRKSALPVAVRLPHFPFALIGCNAAKRELLGIFKNSRLVTVVGVGGVGKTRFAVQIGEDVRADYHENVGFIDLTPCAPNGVLHTVANALGVKQRGNLALADALREFLAPRRLFLILDNCEHLIDEVAALVSELIRDCPQLRLLLTSRQLLLIEGEQAFELQPLALPAQARTQAKPAHPESLLTLAQESPAVRLFVERATAVSSGFRLTAENCAIVVDLCRLVDGLPLGIEIVASRTAGIPLQRIAAELSHSALQLQNSKRAIPLRHQTLHAALDWSYSTLSRTERALLRRLAVFTGGWTLEAAEQVCADEIVSQQEIAAALAALVTKSLVVMERSDPHAPPYRFLETIRAYAEELLHEHAEAAPFMAAHCRYYLDLAAGLHDLSRIKQYLEAVDRNRSNLYSAMQRALVEPALIAQGHRIAMELHTYWSHRALSSEARDWHRSFLNAGKRSLPPGAQAASMLEIAEFCAGVGQGGSEEAMECQRQALEIYRELGDRKGEIDVTLSIGMRHAYKQQLLEAYANFDIIREYYQQTDHPYMVAFMLILMSGCLHDVIYDETCAEMYAEALEIARSRNMPSVEGLALMSMGERAHRADQLLAAERHFAGSVAAYSSIDSHWGTVKAASQLAEIKRLQGDYPQAQRHLHRCLARSAEFSNRRETLFLLAMSARLLHSKRDWEASLSLSAGLLQMSDRYPDELDAYSDEFQAIIREATVHIDKPETEAILLGAGMADFDTLLDYALSLLEKSS